MKVVANNKKAPVQVGKRTFKGKPAIIQYILEQALKHDIQFARKLVDEFLYDDHRLTITDDGTILLLVRESQLKLKKK